MKLIFSLSTTTFYQAFPQGESHLTRKHKTRILGYKVGRVRNEILLVWLLLSLLLCIGTQSLSLLVSSLPVSSLHLIISPSSFLLSWFFHPSSFLLLTKSNSIYAFWCFRAISCLVDWQSTLSSEQAISTPLLSLCIVSNVAGVVTHFSGISPRRLKTVLIRSATTNSDRRYRHYRRYKFSDC